MLFLRKQYLFLLESIRPAETFVSNVEDFLQQLVPTAAWTQATTYSFWYRQQSAAKIELESGVSKDGLRDCCRRQMGLEPIVDAESAWPRRLSFPSIE